MRALALATLLLAATASAEERTEEDRQEDESRKPRELLALLAIQPGWKVLDIGAGGGYTTELLARAVGPSGKVYSQNNQFFRDNPGFKKAVAAYEARLARPANRNVVAVRRELDNPAPPEARNLDLAIIAFLYHDTAWLGTDREKMNRAIFAALAPGGLYVVLDHAARDGAGLAEVKSLHRIEEKVVVDEIQRAGFVLARRGDFLRNPADPRDASVFGPLRKKTDRFVLVFQKPQEKR